MITVYAGSPSDSRNLYQLVDAELRSASDLAARKAEKKPR